MYIVKCIFIEYMKGLITKTTTTTAAEINDDTTNMQATVSQSQTLVFWFLSAARKMARLGAAV